MAKSSPKMVRDKTSAVEQEHKSTEEFIHRIWQQHLLWLVLQTYSDQSFHNCGNFENLIHNFSNKNSANCILLHKFSLFYTILAIFHKFFHIFTKKFKHSKNALVTLVGLVHFSRVTIALMMTIGRFPP